MHAGDMFSRCTDKLFGGIPSVFSITDDLNIMGEEETKHDTDLFEACEAMKYHGLVFNLNKCIIKAPENTYFGYKRMVAWLTLAS